MFCAKFEPLDKERAAVKLTFAFGLVLLAVSPARAVDPTGVPPCDALLRKYESCSSLLPPDRVHAAQKGRSCSKAPAAFAPTRAMKNCGPIWSVFARTLSNA